MKELYTLILYQPIYNALVFIYNIVPGHDIGIAIILLTIIIKFLLNPLTAKSLRSQRDLQRIQPKIQELQQKFKNQKDVLSQELMKLYKSEKVNPFSSCLPLLIQLPFFIAVFSVFRNGLTDPKSLDMLYPFITNPGEINHISFGMFDLYHYNGEYSSKYYHADCNLFKADWDFFKQKQKLCPLEAWIIGFDRPSVAGTAG